MAHKMKATQKMAKKSLQAGPWTKVVAQDSNRLETCATPNRLAFVNGP